jgi:photosystem II stability/assembly factor-like uncharacterized protein
MKLLTPEVGWAATTRSQLFWATNGGQQWRDVTPRAVTPEEKITAIFFLDSSTGWMLFTDGKSNDDQPRFHLAATTDGGCNGGHVRQDLRSHPFRSKAHGQWLHVFPRLCPRLDQPQHRDWLLFHPGAALATQDGGKTWNWVQMGSGSAGRILDGWIISPDQTELYVTHDDSKSSQGAPPLEIPAS